jgi:hypothetical protein
MKAFKGASYKKRKLVLEIAEKKARSKGSRPFRDRGGKRPARNQKKKRHYAR